MSKINGSTNGSGGGDDKDKIVHFPSLAERKKKIMERQAKPAAPAVPFFNLSLLPPFTRALVLSFIIVQIILTFIPDDLKIQIFYTFGFLPAYFSGVMKPFPYGAAISPITHIFIHGGWMHLAFNSVMALSLGMFFEREFGARTTAIFFFACGLAGALFYFILNPFSTVPVIGASGGISGLFGAMIMLMGPRGGLGQRTRGPWPLIIFWVGFMVLAGLASGDTLAWQAHVGGFLAGIGLLQLMKKGYLKIK